MIMKKTYIAPLAEAIALHMSSSCLLGTSPSFEKDDNEDVDFSDKSNNKVWNSHIWSSMEEKI